MGRIFQFLLIIAAVGFLVSPPVDLFAQEYLYDRWGVKEGLPQNTVNQVIQTRDGYIWLATESGLTRFDGVEFLSICRRRQQCTLAFRRFPNALNWLVCRYL
ncbi:MAG: hypothetical protein LC670_10660 [Flavobacteriales bacterium]|nr:hypothetical protein [Flavobacteriales bacterium]